MHAEGLHSTLCTLNASPNFHAYLSLFHTGLTENRCLSRKADGAKLLQVGEQDVAFGAKFRAKVVLDIQEHGAGTPSRLCSNHSGGKSSSPAEEQLYPSPRCPAGQCKDICFSLVEGDFQVSLFGST